MDVQKAASGVPDQQELKAVFTDDDYLGGQLSQAGCCMSALRDVLPSSFDKADLALLESKLVFTVGKIVSVCNIAS